MANRDDFTFQKIVAESKMDIFDFCDRYQIPADKGVAWQNGLVYCPPYVLTLLDRFVKEDNQEADMEQPILFDMLSSSLQNLDLREMLEKTGLGLKAFCERYDFSVSTFRNWVSGKQSNKRECPEYARYLIYRLIIEDFVIGDLNNHIDLESVAGIKECEAFETRLIVSSIMSKKPDGQEANEVYLMIGRHKITIPAFLWQCWQEIHPACPIDLLRNIINSMQGDYTRADWKLRRAILHEYLYHEEFLSIARLAKHMYRQYHGENTYAPFAEQKVVRQVQTLTICSDKGVTLNEKNYLTILNQMINTLLSMNADIYFCMPLSIQNFLTVVRPEGETEALVYVFMNHTVCFQVDIEIFAYEIQKFDKQLQILNHMGILKSQGIETYLMHQIDGCTGSKVILRNANKEQKQKKDIDLPAE